MQFFRLNIGIKIKNGALGTSMTIKKSKVCLIRVGERGTEERKKEEL